VPRCAQDYRRRVFVGGLHETMRPEDVLEVLRVHCQVDLPVLPPIHRRPDVEFGYLPSLVMPTVGDAHRLLLRRRVHLRVPVDRPCHTRHFYMEIKPFI